MRLLDWLLWKWRRIKRYRVGDYPVPRVGDVLDDRWLVVDVRYVEALVRVERIPDGL